MITHQRRLLLAVMSVSAAIALTATSAVADADQGTPAPSNAPAGTFVSAAALGVTFPTPLPAGTDPTELTSAQLAAYGLPPAPAVGSPGYSGWYKAMKSLGTEVEPTEMEVTYTPLQAQGPTQFSYNWSGQQTAGAGPYDDVSGSWYVPSARSDGNERNSAEWLGLGGFAGEQLVQAGTVTDTNPSYDEAVWEVDPASGSGYTTLFPVNVNDAMYVNLYGSGSTSEFFVEDESTRTWSSPSFGASCGSCNAAEAILEKYSGLLTWYTSPMTFSGVAAINGAGAQYMGSLPHDPDVISDSGNSSGPYESVPTDFDGSGDFSLYRQPND